MTEKTTTVLASLTRAMVRAAVELGHSRDDVLERLRLQEGDLADDDARIPSTKHEKIWGLVTSSEGALDFGSKLGLDALGALGNAARHGPTLGAALSFIAENLELIAPGERLYLTASYTKSGSYRICVAMPVDPSRPRAIIEANATAILCIIREVVGVALVPLEVALPFAPPDNPTPYRRHLGPVRWRAGELRLVFDADALAMPLPGADPLLHRYFLGRTRRLLRAAPRRATFAATVSMTLDRHFSTAIEHGTALPDAAALSRALGLTPRTLHRRLQAEGANLRSLFDAVRRNWAERMVGRDDLSNNEIAKALGFSEPSAFFRAFRRWTGVSPQAWLEDR